MSSPWRCSEQKFHQVCIQSNIHQYLTDKLQKLFFSLMFSHSRKLAYLKPVNDNGPLSFRTQWWSSGQSASPGHRGREQRRGSVQRGGQRLLGLLWQRQHQEQVRGREGERSHNLLHAPVSRSSSRECPPQLPPRDNGIYSGQSGLWSTGTESQARPQTSGKKEKKKTGDDPYYFGLSARIPNFVKSRKKKQKERNRANTGQVHLT